VTLQQAVMVLEDVDLVAEDRSFGPGSSPVLFDLLDAMDGAAPDADLLFVLTTNRADLLELALAARPGRVDVAIEIELPDAEARARLLALYGRTPRVRSTICSTAVSSSHAACSASATTPRPSPPAEASASYRHGAVAGLATRESAAGHTASTGSGSHRLDADAPLAVTRIVS
jgi:hypothetical protein